MKKDKDKVIQKIGEILAALSSLSIELRNDKSNAQNRRLGGWLQTMFEMLAWSFELYSGGQEKEEG